jgi:hypothetical protein
MTPSSARQRRHESAVADELRVQPGRAASGYPAAPAAPAARPPAQVIVHARTVRAAPVPAQGLQRGGGAYADRMHPGSVDPCCPFHTILRRTPMGLLVANPTLLRPPTGIFYAGDAKANVLFFDRKPPSEKPWTDRLWIYDFRTNQNFTLKTRALVRADLDDFVACYNPAHRQERPEKERFRAFNQRRAGGQRQGIPGHLLAPR